MSKITDLSKYREAKEKSFKYTSGSAHCVQCSHTWVASGEVGNVWFECPECHSMKGVFDLPFQVEVGKKYYHCGCDNYLMILSEDGIFCPNCGFFVDEEFYK